MTTSKIKISEVIAPAFHDAWANCDKYTTKVFKGGRNSGKSTTISRRIIYELMKRPINALVVRKVGETLENSVFEQLLEAIDALGVGAYWQIRKSPLGLKYMPTGTRILFRGADKPEKIKSIKTSKHPIAILWIEELDEFKSEDEVGVIVNSIIRAELPPGLQYSIFFSYNPPKRKQNWVNKKYNTQFLNPNVYVHQSTYLDNPYVSQAFIDEAESVKALSPHKYNWIFMGEPIGGGIVPFENLSFRRITDEEITQYDQIRQGIDWGYAADAFAFVRLHYDRTRRRVFVLDEFFGVKKSNREVAQWIKSKGYENDLIIADSAEPKSINELRTYGINITGAKKGPGSVETGERWLDDLEEIVIDYQRTPNTAREFENIDYQIDKDGEIKSKLEDKDNHCFAAGTKIKTINGDINIENIKPGDFVLTRYGYKRVLKTHNNGIQDTVKIKLSNGKEIISTKTHKYYVKGKGYIPLDTIRYADDKLCSLKKLYLMESHIGLVKMDIIDHQGVQKMDLLRDTYIDPYGKIITKQKSQRGITSTIKTKINLTTIYQTSNVYRNQNICLNTLWNIIENILMRLKNTSIILETLQKNGTVRQKAENGTRNTRAIQYATEKNKNMFVTYVTKNFMHIAQETIDSALMYVNQNGDEIPAWMMFSECVDIVGKNLKPINILKLFVVVDPVQINCVLPNGNKQVYDLTVEGCHEYFANGVLVHNCVDSTRYAMEDDIGKDNIDINLSIFTGFGGMKEEDGLW